MTGFIGGSFLGCGAIAAFAVADVPAGAFAAGAAFGALGIAGAWVRLRRRWRSRSQGMRLPPLTGRRFWFAGGIATACAAWTVIMAFLGSLAGTAVYGSLSALTAMWCAVSVRAREAQAERPRWATGELAVLDARASLKDLLAATEAQAKREGKFR